MTWTGFDFQKHVARYQVVHYHSDDDGYISWRRGTGDNVEIMDLKVREPRRGHGRRLFRIMLDRLKANPPYAQVFVFARQGNVPAWQFYQSMGMAATPVVGVYADGVAVLLSCDYNYLKEKHGVS